MAHVEMVQGDIRILAGWTNEPPIVSQLNEIVLIVTRVSDGQPINNALSQVAVTVNKGAAEYTGLISRQHQGLRS